MKLVILESGAKAKTIKKYLGKGWIVDACNGHVQDLPSGRKTKDSSKAMWASKPGELPQPPWSWTDRAERVMSKIKSKAKKSGVDEVYIATDPDREGEFIAWRLGEILSEFDSVKRVTFNEITKDAVSAAISSPSELDMDLVEAAIVRRLMDRLVGFRCSKFCRSWKLKSMGRVQTPTLGYIVEKEIEREAHVPKEYNSVSALSNGVELKVRFHESNDSEAWKDDDGKHFPDRTSNTEIAKLAFDIINTKRSLKLETVKEGNVNRKPKAPFTTDTMLQTSSSTLGWSISKTSKVASILYQAGHITYIRTDSTRTNANARGEIRKYIESNFGQDFIGDGVGESGKSKGGVQDAHEAIRPTIPSLLDVGEDRDERALYRLIWSRFAASQMSNSIRERRSLTFSCDGLDKPIIGTSTWRTHSGWEEVFSWLYNEVQTNPPEIGFATGSNWQIDGDAELTIDFTKPPRRFTESSIIQQMKKDGIGRPST
ncbi:MAG: type IA DNA topoisomerase, partial [Candidatus Thermoplasmatota archaeon]|nr:type IA DNA topoisomerase [Candidatus Thermoplasmatota archaeon]